MYSNMYTIITFFLVSDVSIFVSRHEVTVAL